MIFATILAVLFAAILGAVICFLGYRAFLVMLPIWGFFAGFWLGAASITLILGQGFLATVTGWVVGFVIGVILALLSYLFYAFAVAILAALLGMVLTTGVMLAIGFNQGFLVTMVAVIVGILLAIVAIVFNLQKYVVIVLTAFLGADLIVLSGMLLFGVVTLTDLQARSNLVEIVLDASWLAWLVWLAFTIAGIYVQWRANRTYVFTRDEYVEAWG